MNQQPLYQLPNGTWLDLSTVTVVHGYAIAADATQSRICLTSRSAADHASQLSFCVPTPDAQEHVDRLAALVNEARQIAYGSKLE